MTRLGLARSRLKEAETLLTVLYTFWASAASMKGYNLVTGSRIDAPSGYAFKMCLIVSYGARWLAAVRSDLLAAA